MKKLMLSIFALAAVVLSASAVDDARTISQPATGKVEFITPITLSNPSSQSLDFGKIAIGAAGGTVTMTATVGGVVDAPDLSGDAELVASTRTYAKFLVGGQSGLAYSIQLPSNIPLTGGTAGVKILTFNTPDLTLSIDDNAFYVGGVLEYPANTTATSYTSTFSVTVTYD